MYTKTIVHEIQRLKRTGLSQRRTALELKINRETVRRYWNADPNQPIIQKRNRQSCLDRYQEKIHAWYRQHGNADVVRQELKKKFGLQVSLRALQTYLKPLRQELLLEQSAQIKAMHRIETPPGQYMQIDFGERRAWIGDKQMKIHLFVATMAYSRRRFVMVFEGEKQCNWLRGIEKAFERSGVPRYVACDNPKSMVKDPAIRGTRSCCFSERFRAFCHYWDVIPVACYPYYPQSKGKVERSVAYVKDNAIAEHRFKSFEDLKEHLNDWMDNVSDTLNLRWLPEEETERTPIARFAKEKEYLTVACKPAFLSIREEERIVGAKGLLRIDNCNYQMPLNYCGLKVRTQVDETTIKVFIGSNCVKQFNKTLDQVKPSTFEATTEEGLPDFGASESSFAVNPLQRPLAVYDNLTGGAW